MPELYGKPFKSQLRARIRELEASLLKTHRELEDVQSKLVYEQFRNEELQTKIDKMVTKAQELVSEGTHQDAKFPGERFIAFLDKQQASH
jgi:septin family protein